ncbi:MAG: glycoside hydrolase family 2 [Armatimonadetes bacterium]|nr:glycoside hydrolase family 2 [Armatimonadota bacterium]
MSEVKTPKNDIFARVATQRGAYSEHTLVEPCPPELPDVEFALQSLNADAVFTPAPKLDSPAKLKAELARLRRAHAKFLRDLAPGPEQTRDRLHLEEFDWRIQTDADIADFASTLSGSGEWSRVGIPHFGAPLGKAVTYYRTELTLHDDMFSRGALFLCFKGVDYKAHVFLNGSYVGSHEGFFAPFEFDVTSVSRRGPNVLVVKVENDAICMSNDSWGEDGALYEGDKLYAATGLGYDDPQIGWHHCPPGMGIYQDVYLESRSPFHIHDVFIRPLPEEQRAEAWVEVHSCNILRQDASIELSVFGQNFRQTLFRGKRHEMPGQLGPGLNYFRVPFDVPNPRLWQTETPWLYQAQVTLRDADGNVKDVAKRQFGMRSFRMDEDTEPKGRFYLNGMEIKLRGANTMGFEQQCVAKKDWGRLIDDILLAKVCHINFWRLTQRPVQPEVYEYCDRLGLMTQTDLPLFAVLRRSQFCEAVREAEEMERLVRSHPCNIVVSYINEPLANVLDKPHRHLARPELESFFVAASEAVRLANPDRVIKPVDGDYDPPGPGLPDNHCYCGWYNGHGLDLGKLHKGYWQKVKPGWYYGCGEFGAEGLDPVELMRARYPSSWLPQTRDEEKTWTPDRIITAQTGRFHYMWFDGQHSVRDWVRASQSHQAWVMRLQTEAFRRDNRMNTFAIHLFIDAFPSGWMKTIMDVDRRPKPAYFAYRDALTPLAVNLRTDRYSFFSEEMTEVEAWVCNDLSTAPTDMHLHYQLEMNGTVLLAGRAEARAPQCGTECQGLISFRTPMVTKRSAATLRLGLLSRTGEVLHDTSIEINIFPRPSLESGRRTEIVGNPTGTAARLTEELSLEADFSGSPAAGDVILIDDYAKFTANRKSIMKAVRSGATAIFVELPAGEYEIGGDKIEIVECGLGLGGGMGPRHFASRATGHRLVKGFEPRDFSFWYDPDEGCVTPILSTTFTAPGWKAILTSGNGDWRGNWHPTLAAAEKRSGRGSLIVCQLSLAGRLRCNPAAMLFAGRLVGMED